MIFRLEPKFFTFQTVLPGSRLNKDTLVVPKPEGGVSLFLQEISADILSSDIQGISDNLERFCTLPSRRRAIIGFVS